MFSCFRANNWLDFREAIFSRGSNMLIPDRAMPIGKAPPVENNSIENHIHERALRITYNVKSSSFQNLLEKDNSVTIHHRNIKILATETYKFLQGLSPPLMNEIFVERNNNYSLRGNNLLTRRRVNSVRYGTETVSFLAPKIWDILPKDIKDSESLDIFKSKIKKWIPSECPCRLFDVN